MASFHYSPYYQSSFLVNNTSLASKLDSMINPNASLGPDYDCTNCKCYGFPCANCNDYIINHRPLISYKDCKMIINFEDPEDPEETSVEDPENPEDPDDTDKSSVSSYESIIKGKSWADIVNEED